MIDAVHSDLGDYYMHIFLSHSFSWLFNFPLNSCTVIYLTSVLYSINRHLDWSNLMPAQTIFQWLELYIVHLACKWVNMVGERIVTSRSMCMFYFNIHCQLLSTKIIPNHIPPVVFRSLYCSLTDTACYSPFDYFVNLMVPYCSFNLKIVLLIEHHFIYI